jgi:PAS domain S-box-containing protein
MDTAERSQRFVDVTTDFAVIHTTLDGVIVAWLGAAERVFGYTVEEAIGQSLSLFFTEDDKRRALDVHEVALARSQGRSEDDRWHVRKDGSRFWASGVLTSIRNGDGEAVGLCKVLRDKTDVRTQIETLENLVERLSRDLEHERSVVRTLAHELRNPLMPMLSALALLQRPDAARVRDKATQILANQVGVLKRLIDDLNSVSLDAAELQRVDVEPVNLSEALRQLVGTLGDAHEGRARHLSLVIPRVDIWVKADPGRLQQMLLNLIGNALKYTRDGGHIDISASIESSMAVVRVDDDGIGISPEMLPRIFELFTRERRDLDIAGSGVGLAVVKQLAAAHGGFIEGRSDGHDKGASFSLRIPVQDQAGSTESVQDVR